MNQIHQVDEGFVAADTAGWIPGVYETESAARARDQVAKAGKSWDTHMVKFDGTVLPR